jgi:hypothetical protein
VSGGRQAGYAVFGGVYHAGVWSGSAASWVDLHALLPAGVYSGSTAKDIDTSGAEMCIAGWAIRASTGYQEAMLWHYTAEPVPEPCSLLTLLSGIGGLCGVMWRRR